MKYGDVGLTKNMIEKTDKIYIRRELIEMQIHLSKLI